MAMNPRIAAAMGLSVAIAAGAEGLRQKAYRDPVGILTVCYGSTANVDPAKTYSLAECRALLDKDMTAALEQVEACVPGLPEHVLAAFGDAAFNVGPKIVCDTEHSTAARMLSAGAIKDACNQLPRWNRAFVGGLAVPLPGLTKRRERERQLCLTGRLPV